MTAYFCIQKTIKFIYQLYPLVYKCNACVMLFKIFTFKVCTCVCVCVSCGRRPRSSQSLYASLDWRCGNRFIFCTQSCVVRWFVVLREWPTRGSVVVTPTPPCKSPTSSVCWVVLINFVRASSNNWRRQQQIGMRRLIHSMWSRSKSWPQRTPWSVMYGTKAAIS